MWIAAAILVLTLAGVVSAFHAIMRTRTAQGAIAWTVSLVAMPLFAVPAYWFLGRRKFHGYVEAWDAMAKDHATDFDKARERLEPVFVEPDERVPDYEALRKLAHMPLCRGNDLELLVDGDATFDSILEGIERAEMYVLVEFYIVHDDGLGRRLKDALIQKAQAGVRVYFVYDELGSSGLPKSYVDDIRAAGGEMVRFGTQQGAGNRFQLNFRKSPEDRGRRREGGLDRRAERRRRVPRPRREGGSLAGHPHAHRGSRGPRRARHLPQGLVLGHA